ncbi:MAG: CDP-diacylglycerol--glycerol-3-phosphate 3-phosphatidyltransferase [Clostridia bacterium]|nr:CDP-diacylglycerol--glycerol-3-phosphate 3-phosphatidyltransferase [Clostridia bacterium]
MNTPNKLTILRIIMTPIFMATLLIAFPHNTIVALAIFAAASITDAIDGNMARKYNLITDFGKFLDPLADKMLTTAAFLCFIQLGWGVGITWITFIVLVREFFITSLRLVSLGSGKVVAANIWGKLKTISQMVSIITVMAFEYFIDVFSFLAPFAGAMRIIYNILLWISAILAVISGVIYFWDNRSFINTKK